MKPTRRSFFPDHLFRRPFRWQAAAICEGFAAIFPGFAAANARFFVAVGPDKAGMLV